MLLLQQPAPCNSACLKGNMKWQFHKKLTLLPRSLAAPSQRLIFYLLFLPWGFNSPLIPRALAGAFSMLSQKPCTGVPCGGPWSVGEGHGGFEHLVSAPDVGIHPRS